MPLRNHHYIPHTPLQANEKKPKGSAKKGKVKNGKKRASFRRSHKKRPHEEAGEEETMVPHESHAESQSESEATQPKKHVCGTLGLGHGRLYNNPFQPVHVNSQTGHTSKFILSFSLLRNGAVVFLYQYEGTFSQRTGTHPNSNHCPLGGTLLQWVFVERVAEECVAVWQQQGCAQLHSPPWSWPD